MFCYGAFIGGDLDGTSKAYVNEVVPIILSSFDPQELTSRASPELFKTLTKDKLSTLFSTLSSQLGAFKKYHGSEGEAHIRLNILPAAKIVTARYLAKADFEKGSAEIKVELIQHNGKWQILGFFVNFL